VVFEIRTAKVTGQSLETAFFFPQNIQSNNSHHNTQWIFLQFFFEQSQKKRIFAMKGESKHARTRLFTQGSLHDLDTSITSDASPLTYQIQKTT
jgi:hypothetical protein